jgi:hypothetical protein
MFARLYDVIRMPAFVVSLLIILFLGIYFEVLFILPPLIGSLFVLYMERGLMLRNVIGGHLIGFGCAFIEPVITHFVELDFLPDAVFKTLIIAVAVGLATLLMVITGLKHEPAIATVLLFFEIGSHKGTAMIFGIVPWIDVLLFLGGLIIVSVITWIHLSNR